MNRKLFRVLNLVFILLIFSCGSSLPGKPDYGEFSRRLQEEPAALIKGLNFSLLHEKEIKKLGEEETLFLGMALLESDRTEEGLDVLSGLSSTGSFPWNLSAQTCLDRYYYRNQDWKHLENTPYGPESLFFQKKDGLLLDNFPDPPVPDETLLYYRGMAALRARGAQGAEDVFPFYLRIPARPAHREFPDALAGEGLVFPEFFSGAFTDSAAPDSLNRLAAGKMAVLDKKWLTALPLLEPFLVQGSPGREGLVEDLVLCYRRAGRLVSGSAFFLEKAEETGDPGFYMAAGRLLRWAGRHKEAAFAFGEVRAGTMPGSPGDERSLWYLLDSLISARPGASLDILEEYAPLWRDREYFSDLVEKITTGMVSRRSWGEMERLAVLLSDYGTPWDLSRVLYILGRLAEEGLHSPALVPANPADLFTRAEKNDHWGYYGWLSRLGLGEMGRAFAPRISRDQEISPGQNSDPVFARLTALGRTDKAAAWYREGPVPGLEFARGDLITLAGLFQKEGEHLESLRMLARLPLPPGVSRNEWEVRYPRIYSDLVEEAAGGYGLSPSLMLGLVREESAFTPDIVSHAGAVGLGQLMPSTAREVAGRMKLGPLDLTDPRSNLTLSAWYLDWLAGYSGRGMPSILAYNGGPGRIRGLRDSWAGLPLDVAVEGIAIDETRRYGRKVLVSSLYYGYLYYQISPEETIRSFFPDL